MYDHLPPIVQAIVPLKQATRLRLEFENSAKVTAEPPTHKRVEVER